MNNKIKNQIDVLATKQYSILKDAIVSEVKIIFKNHKNLVSYTDIMGCSYFTNKNNETVDLFESYTNSHYDYCSRPTYKYFEKLLDLYSIIPDFCIGETIYNNLKK